jgi:hypothetical protein
MIQEYRVAVDGTCRGRRGGRWFRYSIDYHPELRDWQGAVNRALAEAQEDFTDVSVVGLEVMDDCGQLIDDECWLWTPEKGVLHYPIPGEGIPFD